MTIKERLLNTIRGLPTDELPYLPRLDIWYNANKFRGTLPEKYRNTTLKEITQDLGFGYHYVIPDFKAYDGPDRDADVGLGHYRFNTKPYRLEFHNMERKINTDGNGQFQVQYITPVGSVTTVYHYDDRMKADGLTLNVISGHALKTDNDYETVAYIFENCEVIPDYGYYEYFKNEVVGDDGLCIGFALIWASPMHYIAKDLMNFEQFCYESADNPERLEWLASKLDPFFRAVFNAAAGSSAELILSGCNYDTSITPPPMFKEHITPYLKEQAQKLHSMGKFLITHTDGENHGLLNEYMDSEIDIADSICPAPMTSQTLAEIREAFEDRITIWGGLPSVCFLEQSMSDYDFDVFLDNTFEAIGGGKRIILGIADTTPPAAKFDRILKVSQRARQFGKVN